MSLVCIFYRFSTWEIVRTTLRLSLRFQITSQYLREVKLFNYPCKRIRDNRETSKKERIKSLYSPFYRIIFEKFLKSFHTYLTKEFLIRCSSLENTTIERGSTDTFGLVDHCVRPFVL